MSLVNDGTAVSAGPKTAAMADISRLTQAFVRGSTRKVPDRSIVPQFYKQFAKVFEARFTKASLGKVVPAVGNIVQWETSSAAPTICSACSTRLLKQESLTSDESAYS